MKLPDCVSITIEWDGDNRVQWMTAGDMVGALSLAAPEAPVFVVMDKYGNFSHLQIGGEPRG